MSRRTIGIIVLFLGSEVLGVIAGECFYRLFLKSVPPIGLSSLNMSAARIFFILYGLIAGVAIFTWSFIAALLAPMFGARGADAPPAR